MLECCHMKVFLQSLAFTCLLALSSFVAHAEPQPRVNVPMPSTKDQDAMATRIWMNECSGSQEGLVSWNDGEAFPSMGIGHFIWYPAGKKDRFEESFPAFIAFAKKKEVDVPDYFKGGSPWGSKAAFLADKSDRPAKMRRWLATHIRLQAEFMIERSRASLPALVKAAKSPRAVHQRYMALAKTAQGTYCLVDYVNFKGEGLNPSERYNDQGWGLLQVLEEMVGIPEPEAAPAEFSKAAAKVLRRRVDNCPNDRNEKQWLAGWLNRCKSYGRAK